MGQLSLFDGVGEERAAARPVRRARGGHSYVCPQCWQRVSLLLPPAEPPLCASCDERMIYEPPAVARERRPAEPEPDIPVVE